MATNAEVGTDPVVVHVAGALLAVLRDAAGSGAALTKLREYGYSAQVLAEYNQARYIDVLRESVKELDRDVRQFARCAHEIAAAANDETSFALAGSALNLLAGACRTALPKAEFLAERQIFVDAMRTVFDHLVLTPQSLDIAVESAVQLTRLDDERAVDYLAFINAHPLAALQRTLRFHGTLAGKELWEVAERRYRDDTSAQGAVENAKELQALLPATLHLPLVAADAAGLLISEQYSQELAKLEHVPTDTQAGDTVAADRAMLMHSTNNMLARELRIVQWEVFTTDPGKSYRERRFIPATVTAGIDGLPAPELLQEFVKQSWRAHLHFHIPEAGAPRPRATPVSEAHVRSERVQSARKGYEESQDGFRRLIKRVSEEFPNGHQWVVESFSRHFGDRPGEIDIRSRAELVEDGELTFFTLLWLIRAEDVAAWRRDTSEARLAAFVYGETAEWRPITLDALLGALGIASLQPDGRVIATPRWRSLLMWLQGARKRLAVGPIRPKSQSVNRRKAPLSDELRTLPVKWLAYTAYEIQWLESFRQCLLAADLAEYLATVGVYRDELPPDEFYTQFMQLLAVMAPLFDVNSRTALDGVGSNHVLKSCRAAYLPLEYLFRAFQPAPLSVLILALNAQREEIQLISNEGIEEETIGVTPIALGFATIAGAVASPLKETKEGRESNLHADTGINVDAGTRAFVSWILPYWTLLTSLSSDISLKPVQEAATSAGARETLDAFRHEVTKISSYLLTRYVVDFGAVFEIPGAEPVTGWQEQLGKVDVPDGAWAASMSRWKLCPAPSTWEHMWRLMSIWGGSRTLFSDVGINDLGAPLSVMMETLITFARTSAMIRAKLENDPIPRSFREVDSIEETTLRALKRAPRVEMITGSRGDDVSFLAGQRLLDAELNHFAKESLASLIRAILAGLTNAVFHTSTNVDLAVTTSSVALSIEARNGLSIRPEKSKAASEFWAGSRAVGESSVRPLGGKFSIQPDATRDEWITQIEIPRVRIFNGQPIMWVFRRGESNE